MKNKVPNVWSKPVHEIELILENIEKEERRELQFGLLGGLTKSESSEFNVFHQVDEPQRQEIIVNLVLEECTWYLSASNPNTQKAKHDTKLPWFIRNLYNLYGKKNGYFKDENGSLTRHSSGEFAAFIQKQFHSIGEIPHTGTLEKKHEILYEMKIIGPACH